MSGSITALLEDGPLKGQRLETQIVEGRPPKTIDAPGDDGSGRTAARSGPGGAVRGIRSCTAYSAALVSPARRPGGRSGAVRDRPGR